MVFIPPLDNFSGLQFALATFYFSIQIFCDFSGYSDIAIGISKVLGFDLIKNFNKPYFSRSISDFWRRWHISLSQWFKDYLYIPLGGNRCTRIKQYRNLLITFIISGLWHGAAWHFVLWGLLHGLYQIISKITFSFRKNLRLCLKLEKADGEILTIWKIVQVLITFFLVCIAWIFFRCSKTTELFTIFQKLCFIPKEIYTLFFDTIPAIGIKEALKDTFLNENVGLGLSRQVINLALIFLLFATSFLTRKNDGLSLLAKMPKIIRYLIYLLLFHASVGVVLWNAIQAVSASEFVYFQF